MGAALDGDEFPVLRTHINVVSGGVRVFGAGLRELIAAAEGIRRRRCCACLDSELWAPGLCGRVLTRSRDNGHLVGRDRGLALLADQRGVQLAAALGVLHEPRRARWPGQMVVTPVHEGQQGDEQLSAHRGKPVVKAVGVLVVADPLEHSGLDEPTKPVGEHVAADTETCLELLETAQPQEGVPDQEQTPALAHHL